MFGLGASRLITVLIIFLWHNDQGESHEVTFPSPQVKNADEAPESRNATQRRYLVEYSDYTDIPNFKKRDNGYFDYFNLAPEIGVDVKNITSGKLTVHKCCPLGSYFDVDDFRCIRNRDGVQNLTKSEFFADKIKNYASESNYLFTESLPDCGNRSVLSVRVVSSVGIDSSGVAVDDLGVFSKYCVEEHPKHPGKVVVLSCDNPDVLCKNRTCFRKCCPVGQSYGKTGRKCQKADNPFIPEFYNLTTLKVDKSPRLSELGIFLGDACEFKGKYLLERDQGEISYLGLDGSLLVPTYEKLFPRDDFCVEFVKTGNYSGIGTFLCFSKVGPYFENSQLQFFLLSLGFIVSCMFLMLTFLVYLFSPKSQNLYGKTLMCYIACLFTAYLCLAIVELKSKELNKTVCISMGYSIMFSFLAAFFWLNVMSFDIWKTFRLDRSVDRSKTDKKRLRFLWYSLYAWSFPSAITAVCVLVNQVENFSLESIKPYIGEENCWFSKKTKGIYVFFIAPISLVITCNIIFYVQTAWKIWKVKADVNKLEKQKKKRFSANKDQFVINGKLFIVMGVTWSLEIISFFAPHPIWYITDTANALLGVFIFAVFVLKKKVLHQVSQQLRAPLKRMRQLTSSNSDDLSTRKNFQDLNTEGKTCATGTTPAGEESKD